MIENNIENNQLKNTDLFTLLKLIYPSEQYNFKKFDWEIEKNKVKLFLFKQLFSDEKIQFNSKEKSLLKNLLLTEIPLNLRKQVIKKIKKILDVVNCKWSKKRFIK